MVRFFSVFVFSIVFLAVPGIVSAQQPQRALVNSYCVSCHSSKLKTAGVSLEATRNGIQLSENGSTLTMMHPGAAPALVVVSTRGALRARYVDDDTGQVTITNVYAQ